MKIKTIKLICFSPTETSRKIIQGIAKGMNVDSVEIIDLTIPGNENLKIEFSDTDFTIFGAPVYAGRISKVAVERLANIKGNNSLAATIVVYGNREYEDALLELKNITLESGFVTVAAGAFIAEHSFSTKEFPIAQGRPDKEDLTEAEKFGVKIIQKVQNISSVDNIGDVDVPGNYPYREGVAPLKAASSTDNEICTMCKTCAAVCPTSAITFGNKVITKDKCIWCCACVKICPAEARKMSSTPILQKTKWLYDTCRIPKKTELFI